MNSVGRIATADDLPIIDISPLYTIDIKLKEQVAEQMRRACIDIGFFYVKGSRVTQQDHAQLLQCINNLFNLPLEGKQQLAAALSPLHRGYTGLGGSHNCTQDGGSADQKESFLLGKGKELESVYTGMGFDQLQ
jgi:isopenicillin N synthase-like dioxygenase